MKHALACTNPKPLMDCMYFRTVCRASLRNYSSTHPPTPLPKAFFLLLIFLLEVDNGAHSTQAWDPLKPRTPTAADAVGPLNRTDCMSINTTFSYLFLTMVKGSLKCNGSMIKLFLNLRAILVTFSIPAAVRTQCDSILHLLSDLFQL